MPDSIKVKVLGLKELEDKLVRTIPAKAQTKVLRRALRIASRPMLNSARSKARRGKSNSLAIAMSVWNVRQGQRRRTAASIEVGPRRNNKRALVAYYNFYKGKTPTPQQLINGIRHGHLVEWGTKGTPAHPFMRPAMDAHGQEVIRNFGRILGREIEKEAAKGVAKKR